MSTTQNLASTRFILLLSAIELYLTGYLIFMRILARDRWVFLRLQLLKWAPVDTHFQAI